MNQGVIRALHYRTDLHGLEDWFCGWDRGHSSGRNSQPAPHTPQETKSES